ncbi:AMP-binding protein [Cryobacterium sp. SO2]|uniref:AMP-binding protein n=1 Tax=Cryobacterium sp. SO2 TaxID=1897060 RepID=UPI00223DDCE2|nr:AMP-binding protein [Cryobacterium sp. SO2]WEO77308.1 AMP-binding protein [Cryobacterium sp. SO2]
MDIDQRITELAEQDPNRLSFVGVDPTGREETLSRRELEDGSLAVAQEVAEAHGAATVVMVTASNDARTLIELLGVLRSGSLLLLIEPSMAARSLTALAQRVADETGCDVWFRGEWLASPEGSEALTAKPSPAGGIVLFTGGTSGDPKVVVRHGRPSWDPRRGAPLLLQQTGWRAGQTHLVAGGWYHAAPLTHLVEALLGGIKIVTPQVFNPHVVLAALERHRVQWTQLTPSHLQLLAPLLVEHPGALEALVGVLHTAGPCAPRTRETWMEALGHERLHEMYAATESIGVTLCRADEWLTRPGTVGRGFFTRIRIYADDGSGPLAPGEVGTVYMRTIASAANARGPVLNSRDGFRTVYDMGRLDEEGYLYLEGRRDDQVIVGGENVRLEAVVATLLRHDSVLDAAVVAVPDLVLGQRLVALVVPSREGDFRTSLLFHCMTELAPREVPADIRLVSSLQRSEAGKLRTTILRDLVTADG